MKADVVIVGAGIVGSTIARELSKYEVDVAVVEKETDVAFGPPTKANTGVIHPGFDDPPGTVRAEHCSRGNALWHDIARQVGAPFEEVGSLVVALRDEEVGVLEELKNRGHANGVPDLEIVDDGDRLHRMEPHLNMGAVSALLAPTAAITSPYELAIAMMENAVRNGVRTCFETEVTGITSRQGRVTGIQTTKGEIETQFVINAAGLWADRISGMVGLSQFIIHPRKGEYYILDKKAGDLVRHVIFPTPSPISKGIVVTPTVEGNTLIGPNAQDIDDREDMTTTRSGLAEVWTGACKLIPSIGDRKSMIITNFCGLRPEPDTKDFVVGGSQTVRGFINAAGMRSPGLTAAPSVALRVVDILAESGVDLRRKSAFDPRRKPIDKPMKRSDLSSARSLINQDPDYGYVVCRCEHVTKGEILEAIRRGATTLDGVKFRTRAGMGRCQGGFCGPHVLKLMSEELAMPAQDITKRGKGSKVLLGRAKELLRGGDSNGRDD
jgi:glycerol-3-phosphate dehydrogenase